MGLESSEACKELEELGKKCAAVKKLLEETEDPFKECEKKVVNLTEAKGDVGDRKHRAETQLDVSNGKVAELSKELAGIDKANQKKIAIEAEH